MFPFKKLPGVTRRRVRLVDLARIRPRTSSDHERRRSRSRRPRLWRRREEASRRLKPRREFRLWRNPGGDGPVLASMDCGSKTMIQIQPRPEPSTFDQRCRCHSRGHRWLRDHQGYEGRPHDYWSQFEPQLREAFNGLCGYQRPASVQSSGRSFHPDCHVEMATKKDESLTNGAIIGMARAFSIRRSGNTRFWTHSMSEMIGSRFCSPRYSLFSRQVFRNANESLLSSPS